MTSTKSGDEKVSSTRNKSFGRLIKYDKKTLVLGVVVLVVILALVVVVFAQISRGQSHRSESYKEITGAAGLNAAITYNCNPPACDKKHAFDFNVYIYKDNGQQVNVVRPDKDGNVNLALLEGNYIMLIGKQFGKDKLFPQEPVTLKNGQALELKLRY